MELFGEVNDEIERFLFGILDTRGSRAIEALASNDLEALHRYFLLAFEYIDAQYLRTPRGLDWVRSKIGGRANAEVLFLMQSIRRLHCTMWAESVMEVVFADESDLPFLLTDNPVTVYNKACFPGSKHCIYPNQPDIGLMGSQTIFPLDRERCLILTNLEYARKPTMKAGLLKPRTNARYFSDDVGMVRYDKVVRERHLSTKQVSAINYILKKLATKFIAVVDEDHAYPERHLKSTLWNKLGDILMPDSLGVSMTGGEIFAFGAGDKLFHTQDEFGRVPSSPAEREAKLREALKMRETVMEALAKHNREKEGKE